MMNQILKISYKYFKAEFIKMLQQPITNSPETNDKIENFSKEIKIFKRNKMKIMELKNTTEIKKKNR